MRRKHSSWGRGASAVALGFVAICIVVFLYDQRQMRNGSGTFLRAGASGVKGESGGSGEPCPTCAPPAAGGVGQVPRLILDTFRMADLKWSGADTTAVFMRAPKHPSYDVVVDVGTFDGADYTIPAYKLGYTVFSFELTPNNQAKALANFKGRGLEEGKDFTVIEPTAANHTGYNTSRRPHIYFFKAGASSEAKEVKISGDWELAGISSEGSAGGVTGYVVRLDDIVSAEERVYMFKSDTQGHELGVFKGADKLLRGKVGLMQFEFWPAGLRSHGFEPLDALNYVYDRGFICYDTGFHARYIPIDRPSSLSGFVDLLEKVPKSQDSLGGWEDIFCAKVA